jgi:RNA-directed DNA polymerase
MGAEKSQRPGREAAGSRHEPGHVRQTATANAESIGPQTHELMEEVLRRENLLKALRRVQSNKGAPGVDGMRVEELPDYLRKEWHTIGEQLLRASYVPSPVREVQLPKRGGGNIGCSAFRRSSIGSLPKRCCK